MTLPDAVLFDCDGVIVDSEGPTFDLLIADLATRGLTLTRLQLETDFIGGTIETIEGVAQGDHLHPLQQKFLEEAALQCGICTPGFIVAAKALLEAEPNADEDRIRHWLAGNLCRCTGYDKIVRAVLDAADEMRQTAGAR